jgi:hypothetical protein
MVLAAELSEQLPLAAGITRQMQILCNCCRDPLRHQVPQRILHPLYFSLHLTGTYPSRIN